MQKLYEITTKRKIFESNSITESFSSSSHKKICIVTNTKQTSMGESEKISQD